ncbi:MAG: hypothetical protein RR397_05115 [Odoribacter sp.]
MKSICLPFVSRRRGYEGNTTRQRREGSESQSIPKPLGSDWVAFEGRKINASFRKSFLFRKI